MWRSPACPGRVALHLYRQENDSGTEGGGQERNNDSGFHVPEPFVEPRENDHSDASVGLEREW